MCRAQRPQVLAWVGKMSPYLDAVLYGICPWHERGGMIGRACFFKYQRPDRTLHMASFAYGDTLQAGRKPEGGAGEILWNRDGPAQFGNQASWRSRLEEQQGGQNGRCEKPCDNLVPTDGSTVSLDLPTVSTAPTWAFLLK